MYRLQLLSEESLDMMTDITYITSATLIVCMRLPMHFSFQDHMFILSNLFSNVESSSVAAELHVFNIQQSTCVRTALKLVDKSQFWNACKISSMTSHTERSSRHSGLVVNTR